MSAMSWSSSGSSSKYEYQAGAADGNCGMDVGEAMNGVAQDVICCA